MGATRDDLNAFLDLPEVFVPNAKSGPLAGLTLGVKDIFDVAGYVTGCGNPVKCEGAPARRTAPAVQKLLDAGAQFAGKTQTEELAFSLFGQNAHYGYPVNPKAPGRVTGGSSSGSAAAVSGGLVDIATGSDTGGSVRAPASFCGLIGLRTSQGRISLEGTMPLAPSLDTFGWFAKDMATYEAVGEVMLGEDEQAFALSRPLRIRALDALLAGPEEAMEYERMVTLVADIVGQPKTIGPSAHPLEDLYLAFRRIQAKEAWAAHGDWISSGDRQMAPAIKERFSFGATVTLAEAIAAGARRKSFRAELGDRLGEDGFLMMPTVPGPAPRSKSSPEEFQAYRERALHMLCWSGLSGFPQISLPIGEVDGAPFGLSLLGPAGSDRALIALGKAVLEAAA